MWQQRIVIGRRGIQQQDFAVRRHLHMFHLAFSTGGNTRRRRFTQSRARNHADLSRAGLQLRTRLSRPSALEHILAAIESAPIARAAWQALKVATTESASTFARANFDDKCLISPAE